MRSPEDMFDLNEVVDRVEREQPEIEPRGLVNPNSAPSMLCLKCHRVLISIPRKPSGMGNIIVEASTKKRHKCR